MSFFKKTVVHMIRNRPFFFGFRILQKKCRKNQSFSTILMEIWCDFFYICKGKCRKIQRISSSHKAPNYKNVRGYTSTFSTEQCVLLLTAGGIFGDLGAAYKGNFIDFARRRRVFIYLGTLYTGECSDFAHFPCRKFSTFFL